MSSQTVTNWLLFCILIVLAAHLFQKGENWAFAETFRLDDCITSKITDLPTSYLHVVSHTQTPSS